MCSHPRWGKINNFWTFWNLVRYLGVPLITGKIRIRLFGCLFGFKWVFDRKYLLCKTILRNEFVFRVCVCVPEMGQKTFSGVYLVRKWEKIIIFIRPITTLSHNRILSHLQSMETQLRFIGENVFGKPI